MRLRTLGLLYDMRQAAGYILEFTNGLTYDAFLANKLTLHAVERNFTVIGEAVSRLRRHDPETAERITQIHQLVGMRNILVHAYDRVDYSIVWRAVHESVPTLCAEVDVLLREGEAEDGTTM